MTLQRHIRKPVRIVPMGTMLLMQGPKMRGTGSALQCVAWFLSPFWAGATDK